MRRISSILFVVLLVSCAKKASDPMPTSQSDQEPISAVEEQKDEKEEVVIEEEAADRPAGLEDLVSANHAFAFDMHRAVDRPNFVYSPYSLSIAHASLAAGMGGESRQAIEEVFHFDEVDKEALHDKFYRLSRVLDAREHKGEQDRGVRLKVANAVWPQEGMRFTTQFQKIAEEQYLMKPKFLDYAKAPQESQKVINDFVADATSDKIPELLKEGAITPQTQFVVTNAVYFNAAWQSPFSKAGTSVAPFAAPDGEINVSMMSQEESFGMLESEGYKFIELPYVGGEVATYVLLPDVGKFDSIDRSITPQKFEWMRTNLRTSRVSVKLPKFKLRSTLDAKKTLEGMGMKATFENPDFTPMIVKPDPDLAITAIIHEAFISVDEAGTEAAAATGVVGSTLGMPQPATQTFHADRPFTFFVVDKPTGIILFTARVTNPAN